jgi:hypothetical protein
MTTIELAPPPAYPHVALEQPRDATTAAVVRYLCPGDALEQSDAFDHLVAICYRAVQPFYLRDRRGSLTIIKTPQFDSIKGARTGFNARREGTANAATKAWIQEWLLEFLAPYHGKSADEIAAAENRDEFRFIGRLCRHDLLDAVRAKMATKRKRPPHVSLDTPVAEDGTTLQDYIGTDRQGARSSLATGIGFEELLTCVGNIFHAVAANTAELVRLDVLDGLIATLDNAESLEHVTARSYAQLITETIARVRGISPTSARAYKRKFHATMARELAAGNRAVRAVFLELPDQRRLSGRAVPGHEAADNMAFDDTEAFYQDGSAWDEVEAA